MSLDKDTSPLFMATNTTGTTLIYPFGSVARLLCKPVAGPTKWGSAPSPILPIQVGRKCSNEAYQRPGRHMYPNWCKEEVE